ncbi:MAG: ribonuclease R, partial [Gammaproteobacteria bacterium]|nr:ribonuclease R [Gammaproteobacteria bacterium]
MKQNKSRRIDAPAPERSEIVELLEKHGRPLKRKDIFERLGIKREDSREIVNRRLRAMVRDGQLVKNRRGAYGLAAKMDLVAGRVSAHRDGFGFVMPDEGGPDLYL